MDLTWFNPNEVPDQQSFTAIPEGEYIALITDSEEKVTKSGSGSYLQLVFEVMDGPFKGRKIWDRLNLKNPNQAAVDIANRALKAICTAVGVMPRNSSELHNRPLKIHVKVEKDDRGRENNVIKQYDPAVAQQQYQQAPQQQPAQQQQAPQQQPQQAAPWNAGGNAGASTTAPWN